MMNCFTLRDFLDLFLPDRRFGVDHRVADQVIQTAFLRANKCDDPAVGEPCWPFIRRLIYGVVVDGNCHAIKR